VKLISKSRSFDPGPERAGAYLDPLIGVENKCHSIRTRGNWKFGWARRVLFFARIDKAATPIQIQHREHRGTEYTEKKANLCPAGLSQGASIYFNRRVNGVREIPRSGSSLGTAFVDRRKLHSVNAAKLIL